MALKVWCIFRWPSRLAVNSVAVGALWCVARPGLTCRGVAARRNRSGCVGATGVCSPKAGPASSGMAEAITEAEVEAVAADMLAR